jgi:hypothetical protein
LLLIFLQFLLLNVLLAIASLQYSTTLYRVVASREKMQVFHADLDLKMTRLPLNSPHHPHTPKTTGTAFIQDLAYHAKYLVFNVAIQEKHPQ